MSMLDMLTQQLAGGTLGQLSQQLGTTENQTKSALTQAAPLLLAALARNAQNAKGAKALHQALQKDHDGSVFDNLAGVIQDPGATSGDGILRHALGNRRGTVERALSASSGLDREKTASLLTTLAPMIMGALGKTTKQQGLDAGGLARLLAGERGAAASDGGLPGLAKLLDADGDGEVLDDLGNLAKGLFGR